jgi:hypothetical protein
VAFVAVEQPNRVLAPVASEVALVAVDHRETGSHARAVAGTEPAGARVQLFPRLERPLLRVPALRVLDACCEAKPPRCTRRESRPPTRYQYAHRVPSLPCPARGNACPCCTIVAPPELTLRKACHARDLKAPLLTNGHA